MKPSIPEVFAESVFLRVRRATPRSFLLQELRDRHQLITLGTQAIENEIFLTEETAEDTRITNRNMAALARLHR